MAVLDIIINTAAHAAARPLLAQKGGTRPGSPPLMTAGDGWDGNVSLRLWFYNAESGAITSTNVRKAGVSLSLYAKQSRTEAAPYLFEVAGFSEFQDGEGNYGYEAPVNLNTVELLAAVASGSSADAWVDVVEDGDATTQFQVTIRPQVDSGGALPSPAEPPYPHPSQLATKADLDALRGGVPLANAWENPMDSGFFEAGNITITDGVPTALYGTGPMNLVANALPDWQPDTLDISGVLQAGTAANCTVFFTFIDADGIEVLAPSERLAVTISGAGNGEFSIVSASVPAGATRLAFGYSVIDSQQPCEFSSGFVSIGLTAHATLSEITAEALDDILAYKAQAEADAGTVAALVTPAQTIADLVAPAQQDAADVAAAKAAAVQDASDVAAAKASAVQDASTIAGLVPGAQQDAANVADAAAQALPAAAAADQARQDAQAAAASAGANANAVPSAFVTSTSPTYSAITVAVPVTGANAAVMSTVFKGWGSKYNKASVSFNAIRIQHVARIAVTSAADKWSTLHIEVRDCSAGGNSGLGAIIATGSVAVNPELPTLTDLLVPLKSATTGEYITLSDANLTSPYFIGIYAKNSAGTGAVMGRPFGTISNFEGNSFYTTNASSWDNDSSDSCHAFEHVMLSDLADAFVLERLKADRAQLPEPVFAVPDAAYAVVGREFNVYHANLVESASTLNFDYGTSLSSTEATYVKHQSERLTYTPGTAGTPLITVTASEKGTWRNVLAGSFTLNVAASTAAFTRKLLVIGDSTTAAGTVTGELVTLDAADANTALTLIGSQGSGANKHEGIGGWTVKRWHLPAGGDIALNKFSNAGAAFNFAYYLTSTGQAMASGDHVIINLGINDVFSCAGDRAVEATCTDAFARIEAMITSIQSAVPGIRVGIAVTIPPSSEQDSFGANYYAGPVLTRYRRNNILWAKALINQFKGRTGSGVYLVPIHLGLDTVNNMERAAAAYVNSRNTSVQVSRQSNGVHPAVSGYYQIADQIWAYLKALA